MQGPYADHILDAADVCSNCCRRNKTDRVSAYMLEGGGKRLDSHFSRDPRRTSRDYFDLEDEPAHAETVFCDCGVETAYARVWCGLDYQQFKTLTKHVIRTLREKRVDVNARTLMETAYGGFRKRVRGQHLPLLERDAVDELLADAVSAGIATAAASETNESRAR